MTKETEIDITHILKEIGDLSQIDKESLTSTFVDIEYRCTKDEIAVFYNKLLQTQHDPDILMCIIKRLNTFKPQNCLDTLLDIILLKDSFKENLAETEKYIDLRANVAKVISNYKDNKAVLPLLYCMNNKDEHYKVRLACAEALGKIGDKYAVTPLIDLVSDEEEKSVYVRESAATALGMIGDMRAVDSLVKILETKKTFLNKFTFLKERVIEALGKINSPSERVFKALKNSLDDESPQIRINAIEALMNSNDERAIDMIKKALFDKDEEVIENAVIALYNLQGADIMNEIIESNEYSIKAKRQAQEILYEYEDE